MSHQTVIERPKNAKQTSARLDNEGLLDSILQKIDLFQQNRELSSICVGLVSPDRSVGVSSLAYQLAIQKARRQSPNVLLIDANGNDPRQHRLCKVGQGPGLADHVVREVSIEACIHSTPIETMDVLPIGSRRIQNTTLSPIVLRRLFEDLRYRYQTIFVDMPTIDPFSNGIFLASETDTCLLVIDPLTCRARRVKQLISAFEQRNIPLLGTIVNRYRFPLPRLFRRWF
jgi:Mrp family chromosome partitioning ATPase